MTVPISLELYVVLTIIFVVFSGMMAALGYFIKIQFERTMRKLDELSQQRTDCRETLPERFADRADTKASITRIFEKSDDHEKRISVLEDRGGRAA